MRRLPVFVLALLLAAIACRTAVSQSVPVSQAVPFPTDSTPTGGKLSAVHATDSSLDDGQRLILRVLAMLERHDSITARLRHQLNINGKQLFGAGNYWQLGRGQSLKVRLELQIAGQEASLIQVADGRYLWTDRRLPAGRAVSVVDLRRLRSEVSSSQQLEGIAPGHASWSPIQPEQMAIQGGLPALIAALEMNFSFSRPLPMRLNYSPPLVEKPQSIRVLATVGRWKPDRLAALCSTADESDSLDALAASADLSRLPERLPTDVLVLVGQGNDFPYRIEYRRSPAQRLAGGTQEIGELYQLSAEPLVVLEFLDERFDVDVKDAQFRYEPGEIDVDDRTNLLVERLRKQRERMATRGTVPR